ncbi:hypothetical protein vseg_009377 [Gypsophila vaccaria]
MFPMYRDTNRLPYQRHQTPSAQFFNPTWENFRPQMKEDQANAPPRHEYWPHNYGYPAPAPCQNCCSHDQHPSNHYFRPPPYPHFPPPPPYGHYYGGYPYPTVYPQPYLYVPPPYCPMEMPRYEFDKGSSKAFHCCECPNHPPHVKSTSNVKIEEHEPDGEMKKVESLVPSGVNRSPYPILWVPPEYMMNKERPRRVENDADEQLVSSYVEKPQMQPRPRQSEVELKQGIQPVEQDPRVEYQWFPLDMKSIKRLLEGEDVMKPHDEEKTGGNEKANDIGKNDHNKQLSYPIIWMPYGAQKADNISGQGERNTGKARAEEQEVRNKGKPPIEEHSPVISVVKNPEKEVVVGRTAVGDHASGDRNRGNHKTGNVKIIPVKQLDGNVPKSSMKEQEKDVNVSLKNAGESMSRQESPKNDTDVRPSSPQKKSKLPPICLRVDPPRKKNGKISSRSPSPPGEKKVQVSSDSKEERKDKAKEEVQVKEVVGKESCGNDVVISHGTKEEEKRSCGQEHQSEAEGKMSQDGDGSQVDGKIAAESQQMKESKHEGDGAHVKKVLSETEASVIIQSAYRGYAVRRWEPLKKLQQIANIDEEASKIRRQIEKLESCVTLDNKEKIAIGEHIMNLLLKLDTIQGIHPSVRDVRRSVAKELITLQEKLDSIVSQKSNPADLDIFNTEVVQEHPTTFSTEKDSAGDLVTSWDAFEVSAQGEAPKADESEQDHKEGEEAPLTEDQLGESLTSEHVIEESLEANEEPGRKLSEDLVQPAETSSDYEMPESCMEMKEIELKGTTRSSEDFSTDLQDPQTEPAHFRDSPDQLDMGSCDRDEEENLLAKSPQDSVEEQIEDDICRMDWECDLGAVKINLDIDQETTQLAETPQEIEKQDVYAPAPSEKCAVELEKVEEEHEHPESQGSVIDKKQYATPQEIQKKEVNSCAPSGNGAVAEKVEEEHVPSEAQGEVSNEKEGDTFEVQNPTKNTEQVGETPDDKPEVQCDDSVAIEHEHILVETTHEENPSGQASEMGMDEPVLELEAAAKEVPSVTTVTELHELPSLENSRAELTQFKDLASDRQVEEATNESSSSPRAVSDDLIDAELPEIRKEGDDSVQMERRIVEENEKLRDMVEKLLASGKQQQDVITGLTAKVKDLEKKLPKRNKMRSAKHPRVIVSRRKSSMVH